MKITNEMVQRAAYSMYSAECRRQGLTGPLKRIDQHGWSETAWSKVARAALEAALTTPCTCREDVVCGACMSGATDPATAQGASTPPADDVLKARAWIENFLSGNGFGADYSADELDAWARNLIAEVRPRSSTDDGVEAALAVLRSETPGKRTQFECVRAALEAARKAQQ